MSFMYIAEQFLQSVETNKGYALLLLKLIAKEDVDLTIRVAAAIAFKNFVKRNWKIVSFSHFIIILYYVLLCINLV